jgi:hypothetical protein
MKEQPWLAGGNMTAGMTKSQKTVAPHVSAPPSEVTIRTMQSDLSTITTTGGTRGLGEPVALEHSSSPSSFSTSSISGALRTVVVIILIVLGAAAFFGGGYFLYTRLKGAPTQPIPKILEAPPPAAPLATPPPAPPEEKPELSFEHRSFLRNTPDAYATIKIGGAVTSLDDLRDYRARIGAIVSSTPSQAKFIEVAVTNASGEGVAFWDFLSTLNLEFLPRAFLEERVHPDFTYFIHRTSAGATAGFILQLRPGVSLEKAAEFRSLEESSGFTSLFLAPPGAQTTPFKDMTLDKRHAVRAASFENGAFVYGIFNSDYMVFASSQEAYLQAVQKL